MDITDDLLVLVNDAKRRQATYREMGRDAQEKARNHPQHLSEIGGGDVRKAAEIILAEAIKDRFKMMMDNIHPLVDRHFPKDFDRGPKGWEDDPHEERRVMIITMVDYAMEKANWLKMAKYILNDLDEIDAAK